MASHRCSGFLVANEGFSTPLALTFPIPSLFNTSFTSAGPASLLRCGRDRTGVSLYASPCVIDVWSNVDSDAAVFVRLGLDRLLRPSNASRRSVTPTPLVDRARLAREMFSICMSAGATRTRGESPSPFRRSELLDCGSIAMERAEKAERQGRENEVRTVLECNLCCPRARKSAQESLAI